VPAETLDGKSMGVLCLGDEDDGRAEGAARWIVSRAAVAEGGPEEGRDGIDRWGSARIDRAAVLTRRGRGGKCGRPSGEGRTHIFSPL
jgi:hypothetical protein